MRVSILLSLSALLIAGCGHYRSSFETYRGPGGVISRSASNRTFSTHSGEFQLAWPVGKVDISQVFKPHKKRRHLGIDLRGPKGSDIYAAHSGRVIYSGQGFRGYGKMVMVEHSPKWASLYAHLDRIDVREGDVVRLGDRVGRMGRTGRATGVHLHFELIKNKLPVDPMAYLPDRSEQRWVGK